MNKRSKINTAEAVDRPPIEIGKRYTFHSTAMAQEEVTPWSGQECIVVSPVPNVDYEVESLWTVRFDDSHEAHAFEGELNGFYFDSEQCVEFWRKDPNFADQILPPKVATVRMTAPNAVRRYREAATALRAIQRNGGKTAATVNAITRREHNKALAIASLMAAGERGLVGLLVEEEALAGRPDIKERPELLGRLREVRRKLNRWQSAPEVNE